MENSSFIVLKEANSLGEQLDSNSISEEWNISPSKETFGRKGGQVIMGIFSKGQSDLEK
jgi:hypothetical protein